LLLTTGPDFYGLEWLPLYALIYVGIPGAIWLVMFLTLRFYFRHHSNRKWPLVRRSALVVLGLVMTFTVGDLFILFVLHRQDLVPEWLGGILAN